MKRKIGLFLSLAVLLQIFTIRVNADDLQSFTDFDDIKPQYAEAIICVTEAGILSGYPDNTFRPQQFLTRGAAAKIASIMELGFLRDDLEKEIGKVIADSIRTAYNKL